ncbi:hypothetical protein SARC_09342 [Sphaeroforma arctica JP610]|uniref:Enoyl reductase (ER) domain-containing protein n=1 Tax=Sphaeroforma arctica JP610 TaxID=667725 RepID=A0A0L0FN52_9EUKA|nr:hypothetical protein SARC_09342 [Sphaeroforma arctica JP610]KNC78215.1 hypothetical protein SARC_09342 [Sphaeroforma arctica JP610]|eukprot:XP_014152117.1 hypothetical protein SARC_09342 [Sphaeroforma arctica JP610]
MRVVIPVDGKCELAQRRIPEPKNGDVLIEIYATALNRADTLIRAGKYPGPPSDEPEILGLECAGRISGLPPNGSSLGFRVGDRVMTLLNCGGYAEYVCQDERMLMRVSDSLSLYKAGGIPETWLTSYQLLFWNATVKKGDQVLVHAAASGIGTTAVQLCLGVGAVPYATASSLEKLHTVAALGVDGEHCFSRKGDKPWDECLMEVLKAHNKSGIDTVLDPVGGSYAVQNAKVLGLDSSWVLFGLMGGVAMDFEGAGSPPFLATILRKRIRLMGTTLKTRSLDYKIKLTQDLVEHCSDKWADGTYKPFCDDRQFKLEDAQEAHEYMEANLNVGKLIIVVREDADERALLCGGTPKV